MFSSKRFKNGRVGVLNIRGVSVQTPLLFPVVSLVTGTTARGGGLWRYILQADEKNGLMRRNIPLMSQVLHFLDFSSVSPRVLAKWRDQGIIQRYSHDITPKLDYSAPLFLDSGGFKLLWNDSLDLSSYGLSIENGQGPDTVLHLQKDFGADFVATLDYPIPPDLDVAEAEDRMQRSLNNAVAAARALSENDTYKPFLYVAVHGYDKASIGRYTKNLLERFEAEGVINYPFGLAVGSLVPLRGARRFQTIADLIFGVSDNIPENMLCRIPIHAFGITGNLIPLLAYLGVDSYDSSTYVQHARNLAYNDPSTHRPLPILEMEERSCNCRVCSGVALREVQECLTSNIRNKPLETGHYKSKYYSDIALHNLEMDFRIVDSTREAINVGSLQDYLLKHIEKYPELRQVLEFIAEGDFNFRRELTRTSAPLPDLSLSAIVSKKISLKYSSSSFDILSNGYHPPTDKRVLLLIPCSGGKPYSTSRSHQLIKKRLSEALGSVEIVHKVTLSGLYGPVPEECENEPEVLGYDYRLDPSNKAQIDLVSKRVISYLERFESYYDLLVGYATSRAYRNVLLEAAKHTGSLRVLPRAPKACRLTEFFRQSNVTELIEEVVPIVKTE